MVFPQKGIVIVVAAKFLTQVKYPHLVIIKKLGVSHPHIPYRLREGLHHRENFVSISELGICRCKMLVYRHIRFKQIFASRKIQKFIH